MADSDDDHEYDPAMKPGLILQLQLGRRGIDRCVSLGAHDLVGTLLGPVELSHRYVEFCETTGYDRRVVACRQKQPNCREAEQDGIQASDLTVECLIQLMHDAYPSQGWRDCR